MRDTSTVNRVTGRKIVSAIEHHIMLGDQVAQMVIIKALRDGMDDALGIKIHRGLLPRNSLVDPHSVAAMQNLALQFAELHLVDFNQCETMHPRRRQIS